MTLTKSRGNPVLMDLPVFMCNNYTYIVYLLDNSGHSMKDILL